MPLVMKGGRGGGGALEDAAGQVPDQKGEDEGGEGEGEDGDERVFAKLEEEKGGSGTCV